MRDTRQEKGDIDVEYSWHIFPSSISLITLHDTIIKKYTVLCEITIGTISKI